MAAGAAGDGVTWVRVDDKFPDHPKVQHVSDAAGWLFVCGLCYCARQTTDGYVPEGKVTTLTRATRPGKLADELVAAGLWEETVGGFQVHDYLAYQPSAAQVKERRDGARVRKRSQRDRTRDSTVTTARPLTGARLGDGTEAGPGFEETAEIDAVAEAAAILSTVWEYVDPVGVENAWATDPSADLVAAARLAVTWGSDDGWEMGAAASLRSAIRKLHSEASGGRSKAERGAAGVAAISRLMGDAA